MLVWETAEQSMSGEAELEFARIWRPIPKVVFSPDAEFEGMAYYFDDGVDLANNGVYGSLAELRVEMLDYLSRVDDSA